MATEIVNWRNAKGCIRQAHFVNAKAIELESGETLGQTLKRNFNIDVGDPRQLNLLIQEMKEAEIVFSAVGSIDEQLSYFGFDEPKAQRLAKDIKTYWASLTLALADYLPAAVREGKTTMEQAELPPIKPEDFAWYTLLPTPLQVETANDWKNAIPMFMDPDVAANREDAKANIQEFNALNPTRTFMWLASMLILGLLCANHGDDSAVRFKDMMLATTFELLPEKYQELARTT